MECGLGEKQINLSGKSRDNGIPALDDRPRDAQVVVQPTRLTTNAATKVDDGEIVARLDELKQLEERLLSLIDELVVDSRLADVELVHHLKIIQSAARRHPLLPLSEVAASGYTPAVVAGPQARPLFSSRSRHGWYLLARLLAVVLLLFGLTQLGVRGSARFHSDLPLWDFASVYASARAWTHGLDPYNLPAVQAVWRNAGAFVDRDISYWSTVYPPTSLLVIAPLALLPAKFAMAVWGFITMALLAIQFAALIDLARLKWNGWGAIFLIGASIASAPMQFGLLSGQLTLPAVSLCILALWCERRRGFTKWGPPAAGLLLGVACALKPQLCAAFFIYYLFIRRRQPIIAWLAIAVVGSLAIVSLIGMKAAHVDWFGGWTRSISETQLAGGVNDYDTTGPYRDQIVDLKMLIINVVSDPMAARVVVECLVLGLAAWYLRSLPNSRNIGSTRNGGMLPLVTLITISLLPLYHRVYDASLLTLAVAWALGEWHGPRRRLALLAIAPMAFLLVPFDVLDTVVRHFSLADRMSTTWFWHAIVQPHYAWALLGTTLCMLFVMNRIAATRSIAVANVASRGSEALDADEDDDAILAH